MPPVWHGVHRPTISSMALYVQFGFCKSACANPWIICVSDSLEFLFFACLCMRLVYGFVAYALNKDWMYEWNSLLLGPFDVPCDWLSSSARGIKRGGFVYTLMPILQRHWYSLKDRHIWRWKTNRLYNTWPSEIIWSSISACMPLKANYLHV